jgi:NADH-quinone oxidoreductase subunit M
MLHAGVLMKLGAYGILRIAIWILPEGAVFWAPILGTLALVNIVYGALVAIMQKDLKYMIGYSSVSHMGIVVFGLFTLNQNGLNGAVFQMFSHGIMTALLFSSVGFIYDMTHTRNVDELGGLFKKIPMASSFFIVAGLCGLGLPLLSGFPAELLVYIGAYQAQAFPLAHISLYFWVAVAGLVLTAFYVLRIIQRGFFGPLNEKWAHHLHDATPWQAVPRVVLIITLVFFGVAPLTMLRLIQTGTLPIVKELARFMGGM